MRVGYLSLALIIVVFTCAPGGLASATGIALVQSQQPRNQTQPQEGLPPEKKKILSSMGPEDVFDVSGEDPRNRATTRQSRGQRPTTLPSPSPQRQPATSTATPSATPAPASSQSSIATPSPTIAAGALAGGAQQSLLGQEGPSDKIAPRWAAPTLIALALIVSVALYFTLTKLVEKIREGSSG